MTRSVRAAGGYIAMVLVTVGGYLALRELGEPLLAVLPPLASKASHAPEGTLGALLRALAVITITARLLGVVFARWLAQPPVIGEIVAGLLLGPSVLGALAPSLQEALLPAEIAPHLGAVANVGIVLFMFLIGLEVDLDRLRRERSATLAVSHAGIAVPFLLGAALALGLYPSYATADVTFTEFSLFLGVSMSVTAFPVLARILKDRGLGRTALGETALACAAVGDATAWTLLAFVSGVVTAEAGKLPLMLGWLALYLGVMWFAVRQAAAWLTERVERSEVALGPDALAAVFTALLLSALATEAIGIHALFGAFFLGALIPPTSRLAGQLHDRVHDLVLVLFLPAFFAFTGLRTQLALVDGDDWAATLAIIAVATVGKLGGTYVSARLTGQTHADATVLGVLMNTRGLMELVVLNVGLDLGVISPELFAMLVVMALVTTFATSPILAALTWLHGPPVAEPLPEEGAET